MARAACPLSNGDFCLFRVRLRGCLSGEPIALAFVNMKPFLAVLFCVLAFVVQTAKAASAGVCTFTFGTPMPGSRDVPYTYNYGQNLAGSPDDYSIETAWKDQTTGEITWHSPWHHHYGHPAESGSGVFSVPAGKNVLVLVRKFMSSPPFSLLAEQQDVVVLPPGGDGVPMEVVPDTSATGLRLKSGPQLVKNDYNRKMVVEYVDVVTGEVISSETLNPGESLLHVVEKHGDHDVKVRYRLPEGATYVGPDTSGAMQVFIIGSGTQWDGATIPDSEFSADPPIYATPTTQAPGIPPTGVTVDATKDPATSTTTPGNPVRRVVDGRQTAIQFSETAGTGGATDKTLREGLSAVVQELQKTRTAVEAVTEPVTTLGEFLTAGSAYSVGTDLALITSKAGAATAYTGARPTGTNAVTAGGAAPTTAMYSTIIGGTVLSLGFNDLASRMPAADALLVACRPLLLLALAVWFARNAGATVQAYAVGLGNADTGGVNVGVENLVPGVAQGKGWGSAAIAVSTICVAIGALVAVVDTWMSGAGLGVAQMLSGTSFAPLGAIWGILDRYVPMAAVVQLGMMNAAMPYVLAPIYATALSVLKFCKI